MSWISCFHFHGSVYSLGQVVCVDTHAGGRIFGYIVPQFDLHDLGGHGLDIFLSVIFGDSSENEDASAN